MTSQREDGLQIKRKNSSLGAQQHGQSQYFHNQDIGWQEVATDQGLILYLPGIDCFGCPGLLLEIAVSTVERLICLRGWLLGAGFCRRGKGKQTTLSLVLAITCSLILSYIEQSKKPKKAAQLSNRGKWKTAFQQEKLLPNNSSVFISSGYLEMQKLVGVTADVTVDVSINTFSFPIISKLMKLYAGGEPY